MVQIPLFVDAVNLGKPVVSTKSQKRCAVLCGVILNEVRWKYMGYIKLLCSRANKFHWEAQIWFNLLLLV